MENSVENANQFYFSKIFYETRTIHSVSNNIENFMGEETDEIIDELFESLLQRYQISFTKISKSKRRIE